jgi:hypothetical protein
MHALGIEAFTVSHLKQGQQNIAANLCRAGLPGHSKVVTATGDFDIEAAFNLPQMFIKLTAEVSQAVVIGGLEDNVPRNLDSIQST